MMIILTIMLSSSQPFVHLFSYADYTAAAPTLSHSGHTLHTLHVIHELPNSCRTSANTPSDRSYTSSTAH